jgi:plasmid rolling circle replication initiator protein Rep
VPVWFCKSPLPWPEEKRQQAGHAVRAGQCCASGSDVESAGLIRLHCLKRRLQSVNKGEICAFHAPDTEKTQF